MWLPPFFALVLGFSGLYLRISARRPDLPDAPFVASARAESSFEPVSGLPPLAGTDQLLSISVEMRMGPSFTTISRYCPNSRDLPG